MNKHTDIAPYALHIFEYICSNFFVKCLFAYMYMTYSFLFGIHQQEAQMAILILIICDFATGIWAAKIAGDEIKSAKIFRTATKIVVYFLFIAVIHTSGKAYPIIQGISDQTIVAFLALTEVISIIENIGKMGFAIPKKMLNKLEELRDNK